jgi:hypothetical protein
METPANWRRNMSDDDARDTAKFLVYRARVLLWKLILALVISIVAVALASFLLVEVPDSARTSTFYVVDGSLLLGSLSVMLSNIYRIFAGEKTHREYLDTVDELLDPLSTSDPSWQTYER